MRQLALILLSLSIAVSIGAGDAASQAIPFTTTRVISGLQRPVYVTAAPGDASRLFILEQFTGKILIRKGAWLLPQPFMTQTGISIGNESGLLGMAFHPEYPDTPYFYVNFTRTPDGATVIRRYKVSANPDVADPSSGLTLMTVNQNSNPIHNAGWLAFGPDGYLYIAIGDKGDPNFVVAQSDTTRQGKILRIDVDHGSPYAIPPDNPFFASPSPKNEFWAYGFRNPWRCSFDRFTGALYVADVGEAAWEEIDYESPTSTGGQNYGWARMEGRARSVHCPPPCDTTGFKLPIHDYSHAGGRCSITGGYVYRGSSIFAFQGRYIFADFCTNQIWTLRVVNGVATEVIERTAALAPGNGLSIQTISSFGQDATGELYICDLTGGEIFKIIPYPTSVGPSQGASEPLISLGAPTPNPSDGGFSFAIGTRQPGRARVEVLDTSGRLITTLLDATIPSGFRTLTWDGSDEQGQRVSAGVYLVRFEAAETVRSEKLHLLR